MAAPKCVRFAPTDEEVFDEFLIPKLAHDMQALEGSLIQEYNLYQRDPIFAERDHEPLFLANHFWYFVTRVPLKPSSPKPNRNIQNAIVHGQWKNVGKAKLITNGNTVILGKINTLDFVNTDKMRTGWRQCEYDRILDSPIFQTMVVVHLFYDMKLDQTAHPQVQQPGDDFFSI